MRQVILLLGFITLLLPIGMRAQKQNNVWVFGDSTGVDFNGPTPIPLGNTHMHASEGSASVADRTTGQLLFYTNGESVWNSTNKVMPNGINLGGHRSSLQAAAIFPDPADSNRYYLFTTDARENYNRRGLRYSIIDMREDGGLGDVVERSTLVVAPVGENLCVVRVCGENKYWVITHTADASRTPPMPDTSMFYAVAVSRDGVSAPIKSPTMNGFFGTGMLKASHDGSLIVTTQSTGTSNLPVLYRFDQTTGRLTQLMTWPQYSGQYFCFSPDDSKLYTATVQIHQYDVTQLDSASIVSSRAVIYDAGASFIVGDLQLAPNGKIYVSMRRSPWLSAINNPNSAGASCNFELNAIKLGVGEKTTDGILPTVVNVLEAFAGNDTAICEGSSLQLHGVAGGTYSWSPSSSLTCADCADPIATPTQTTTYYLTTSNTSSCQALDSITVTVIPRPRADAGRDTTICRGTDITLHAAGGPNVRWISDPTLSCIDCADPVARPSVTTTYRVVVSNEAGCESIDSITVTVVDGVDADAGRDTSICFGGSVQLVGSNAESWQWSPSTGLSCVDCQAPIATPSATTRYYLMVTSQSGCVSVDSVLVAVVMPPAVDAGRDTSICAGQSLQLTAVGATSYSWDPDPTLSCVDCAVPIATTTRSTTYYVTGWTPEGCSARDSIQVVVGTLPTLRLSGDSAVCRGGTARVKAEGASEVKWWTLSGPVACPTCLDQTVSPSQTTTLYVEASNGGSCSVTDSFVVRVLDQPEISVSGSDTVCQGEAIQLSATGASAFVWEPADGLSCSTCASPIASPTVTMRYRVIGTLSGGCSDTAFADVVVRDADLVHASIERGVPLMPAESRTFPVTVDAPFVADTLWFTVHWRRGVLRMGDPTLSTPLLNDGWSGEVIGRSDDSIALLYHRVTPGAIAPGAVIQLPLTAYLGDAAESELPFTLRSNATCTLIDTRAGQVLIDSICGLSYRLIEVSSELLRLSPAMPNPVRDYSVIQFTIPFEAEIEIDLIDALGVTRRLANGVHRAGPHEISLDGRDLPQGLYQLQLRMGDLVREQRVIVVR